VGLLGVERAGLFSGVLPVSALVFSAALGVAELTPGRLAAVAVVAIGVTLGVRGGALPVGGSSSNRLRTSASGA
jgi:hypothetical protein